MDFNWIEIEIFSNPLILEEMSPFLFNMGFEGITEKQKSFVIYIKQSDWNSTKEEKLKEQLKAKNIDQTWSVNIIENQNWNENWKDNFKRFTVGKHIVIKPDWDTYTANKDEILITIAPKMAFGTGHHQTTQLILQQMEKCIEPGMRVLDAGTGSGILAVYAAKSGAESIVAFDNDPQAIVNARENCHLNSINQRIELHCCDIDSIIEREFDLIIANINRNILRLWPETFKNFAKMYTKLLLSGLLKTDQHEMIHLYKSAGWQFMDRKQLNEWIALSFINK
jgi:ribosomal protein L11 methyltransferase